MYICSTIYTFYTAGYMRNFLLRNGKAKYIPLERVILRYADKQAIAEAQAVKKQQEQELL
jgi:ribosomal protein L9